MFAFSLLDVEATCGTTLDLSKLGKTTKREERSEVRSAKRTEKRGEGREKIEKNVEASNLKISA